MYQVNIELLLTKYGMIIFDWQKDTVIFQNLTGYDGHLIIQEIVKFDKKISVIPNFLEKHMDFMIGKNLGFFGSSQLLHFSLK